MAARLRRAGGLAGTHDVAAERRGRSRRLLRCATICTNAEDVMSSPLPRLTEGSAALILPAAIAHESSQRLMQGSHGGARAGL